MTHRFSTLRRLAVALLAAACSGNPTQERVEPSGSRTAEEAAPKPAQKPAPRKPAPEKPPSREKDVITVKTTEDLNALRDRYLEALASGKEEHFEVELAPGTYGPANVSLSVPAGQRIPDPILVDVTLRGSGDAVVLADTGLSVTGRTVRIENLVFSGAKNTVLKVQAGRAVVLKDSAVLANRWTSDFAGISLVDVMGIGKTAIDVTVEGCWFVGNRQTSDKKKSTVFTAKRAVYTPLAKVLVKKSVFVGNDVAAELAITGADALRLEDVIVHRARKGGAFLELDAVKSAEIAHAGLVVESLDTLAVLKNGAAVKVRDSRLYAKAKTALPDSLDGDAGQVGEQAKLKGWDDAVAKVLELTGDRMPDEALRTTLETALGW